MSVMDRDEAIALLRGGPNGIKEWGQRRRSGEQAPSLNHVELSRANLDKAELGGVDLSYAILRRVNLDNGDLTGANLRGANLYGASLVSASFNGANLRHADLYGANLRGANLSDAILSDANLRRTDLTSARLIGANLYGAELHSSELVGADLSNADLRDTTFVRSNLRNAILDGCLVHGISAWGLDLRGAQQSNLVISGRGEATITVDNLEVAQFIYLLLHNERIRQVIDTITSKVVLVLGRFTPERKAVLDAIREALRKRDYCPVMFDFETPASRDTHETVTTLARLARFVIADITDPKSIPQELVSVVETLPSVPVQPLLQQGSRPWGMYAHIKRYPWVLTVHEYADTAELLNSLAEKVIRPAEEKASELRPGK